MFGSKVKLPKDLFEKIRRRAEWKVIIENQITQTDHDHLVPFPVSQFRMVGVKPPSGIVASPQG